MASPLPSLEQQLADWQAERRAVEDARRAHPIDDWFERLPVAGQMAVLAVIGAASAGFFGFLMWLTVRRW